MEINYDKTELGFLCDDLFKRAKNHTLLYGKHEHTLGILKEIYKRASKKGEFLCS